MPSDAPTPMLPVAPPEAPAAADGYLASVRQTLIALGASAPDADIGATGDFWRHCFSAGIPANVAAATIYATARHKHHGATTLKESVVSESPMREEWEVIVRRGGVGVDEITAAAGRRPDEVTAGNAVFAGFKDDEKATAFSKKMTKAGYISSSGPRRDYTLHEEDAGLRWGRTRDGNWEAFGARAMYEIGHRGDDYHLLVVSPTRHDRIFYHSTHTTLEAAKRSATNYEHGLKANEEGDPSAMAEEKPAAKEECHTCIPWRKVARDPVDQEAVKKFGKIKTAKDVYRVVGADLTRESAEVFLVLPLDIHGKLMGPAYEVARGQRDRVTVGIDNVMDAASDARCAGYVVVHNHPGGSAEPSEADLKLTKEIQRATPPGRTMLDHVIITQGAAYSCIEKKTYKVKA